MKVLDPQSALLTTAEVYQFMQDNPPRKPDQKIGSYPRVNLHNHEIVRSDFQNFIKINQPHLVSLGRAETFMKDLISRLEPYDLTKAEVYTLINLGVGVTPTKLETVDEEEDEEASGEAQESELAKSLFRLVVEESKQRFDGDEGEAKIDEILAILRESLSIADGGNVPVVNGHSNSDAKANGIEIADS